MGNGNGNIRRPHNSRNSPARVKLAERQRSAMELRKAGATYAQIAEELGYYDAKGAERAVSAGLKAANLEVAETLMPLELSRLDRLQVALWPQAIDGDIQAALAVLKIMERRAKMTGLDAPLKVNQRIDSHESINVDVAGINAVMVIRADGHGGAVAVVGNAKDDYLAGLRAMRGDIPVAIEGSSTVVQRSPDGQQPDMSYDPPEDDHAG